MQEASSTKMDDDDDEDFHPGEFEYEEYDENGSLFYRIDRWVRILSWEINLVFPIVNFLHSIPYFHS